MKVLDLDMDYFMERVATDVPFEIVDRLSEEYGGFVWTERRIRQFLEVNLGLSKQKKLPGRVVTGHNESLFFWEELVANKKLTIVLFFLKHPIINIAARFLVPHATAMIKQSH